jgi:hypothetical protein
MWNFNNLKHTEMKLKFVEDGTIYRASRIHTPAGIFNGIELFNRDDFKGRVFDTTLSWSGRERLSGERDDLPAPEKFHILIDGWGWCQVDV